jgi:hypothetical protein
VTSGGPVEEFGDSRVNAATFDELKFAVDVVLDSRKLTLIKAVVRPTADSTSDDIGNPHPDGAFTTEG